MSFKSLLETWSAAQKPVVTRESYSVKLRLDDAARLHALADLFPDVDRETIISDLLSAALDKLEAVMPYEPGTTVIEEDDQGDPIYEDVGLTPRFLELAKKHRDALS